MARVRRCRRRGSGFGLLVVGALVATSAWARAAEPPAIEAPAARPELKWAPGNELNRQQRTDEGSAREQKTPDEKARAEKAREEWAREQKAKEEKARAEKARKEKEKQKAAKPAGSPGRSPGPELGEYRRIEPAPWRELWRVRVGNVGFRRGQIAVRGPLVVVASWGAKAGPDPLDGVYVIDGRSGAVVRTIRTSDDAYGVGLRGDVVVFGVGNRWQRVRLDGWPLSPTESPEIRAEAPGLERQDNGRTPLVVQAAVVAEDLIPQGGVSWVDLTEKESGDWRSQAHAFVADERGETRVLPTPEATEAAPSIGDLDGDGTWDVVVAAGEYVHAYATGSKGELGRAFWTGDIEASGKQPQYRDTPASYAARLPARDVARWLVPDAAPTDTAFEALPAPIAGLPPPSKVTLKLDGGEVESEEGTTCGGEHFAITEGRLVREDLAGWRLVKGAPFPLARLGCSQADGYLQLVAGGGRAFRLPPPLLWRPVAWGVAAAIACALAGLAIYMRWRIKIPRGEEHTDVRRQFISDAPRGALDRAHPDQVRLVRGLAAFLDNDDTQPPMTVALYGKWGSGKSSIMKMLRGELAQTGRYIDVWFNAWRFQNEERLAPALLQAIVDEIGRKSDWMTRLSALLDRLYRARAREVLPVALGGLAALVVFIVSLRFDKIPGSLTALGVFAAGLWRKVLTPLFKVFSLDPAKLLNTADSGKRIGFIRDFGDEFRSVLRRLPKHTRLIVYVDDLDRCSPDRIVPLLETLNMLADTGGALFVIATDRDAVRRAVELVHRETIALMREEDPVEARRYGDRFLDKIVTVGINVPQVKPSELHLDAAAPDPPAPLGTQIGRLLRRALRPRPGWAFFVALLVAIGGPLWAAGRYVSEHADPFENIGKLLGLEDKAAGGATSDAKQTGAKTANTGGTSPAPASPPAGDAPAPTKAAQSTAQRSAGGSRPPGLDELIGRERAPIITPAVSPTPTVAAVTPRMPGEERRFALVLRHLAEGIGLLVLIVIAGVFWAQAEQRRRIAHAPPMAHDSEAFAAALRQWTARLPNNPRTTIRFNNAARFLYYLVGVSHPSETGWEPGFFEIFFSRWSESPPAALPATMPSWLEPEVQNWISDEHRTFRPES